MPKIYIVALTVSLLGLMGVFYQQTLFMSELDQIDEEIQLLRSEMLVMAHSQENAVLGGIDYDAVTEIITAEDRGLSLDQLSIGNFYYCSRADADETVVLYFTSDGQIYDWSYSISEEHFSLALEDAEHIHQYSLLGNEIVMSFNEEGMAPREEIFEIYNVDEDGVIKGFSRDNNRIRFHRSLCPDFIREQRPQY